MFFRTSRRIEDDDFRGANGDVAFTMEHEEFVLYIVLFPNSGCAYSKTIGNCDGAGVWNGYHGCEKSGAGVETE